MNAERLRRWAADLLPPRVCSLNSRTQPAHVQRPYLARHPRPPTWPVQPHPRPRAIVMARCPPWPVCKMRTVRASPRPAAAAAPSRASLHPEMPAFGGISRSQQRPIVLSPCCDQARGGRAGRHTAAVSLFSASPEALPKPDVLPVAASVGVSAHRQILRASAHRTRQRRREFCCPSLGPLRCLQQRLLPTLSLALAEK